MGYYDQPDPVEATVEITCPAPVDPDAEYDPAVGYDACEAVHEVDVCIYDGIFEFHCPTCGAWLDMDIDGDFESIAGLR